MGLSRFRFESPRTVFDNLNLSIQAGEKVLVHGTNGSGKTTLLKLISGLLPMNSGNIVIGEGGTPQSMRHRIGLMLSFEMLYPSLSGWENLEFSGRLHRIPKLEDEIRRIAGYWGFENHLNALVSSYSYGLRARTSLARATLHRPDLLLFDEPTIGLDKEGSDILVEYLRSVDATVIIATHQPETFESFASRSISLKEFVPETNPLLAGGAIFSPGLQT